MLRQGTFAVFRNRTGQWPFLVVKEHEDGTFTGHVFTTTGAYIEPNVSYDETGTKCGHASKRWLSLGAHDLPAYVVGSDGEVAMTRAAYTDEGGRFLSLEEARENARRMLSDD